ncbi:MAG TPA: hypothetical protein VFU15_15810, partial [Bacteroidia bacterium]|nr:hypothetical protein [Bacteroidia bacterium]
SELKKFCSSVHFFPLGRVTIFFNLLSGLFSGIPLQVAYFTNGKTKKRSPRSSMKKNRTASFAS